MMVIFMFDDRRRIPLSHHLISSAGKDAVNLGSGVGVHLPLATSHGNVDETAGVLEALQSTALGLLLLLLLLDLYSRK
jgi:hypothetical protein